MVPYGAMAELGWKRANGMAIDGIHAIHNILKPAYFSFFRLMNKTFEAEILATNLSSN